MFYNGDNGMQNPRKAEHMLSGSFYRQKSQTWNFEVPVVMVPYEESGKQSNWHQEVELITKTLGGGTYSGAERYPKHINSIYNKDVEELIKKKQLSADDENSMWYAGMSFSLSKHVYDFDNTNC